MTKDEIKKALECCEKYAYCKDCPCYTYCEHELHKGALALITEQEKEIERLKDSYARVQEQLRVQEQFAKYQIVSDKEIKAQRKQGQIDVLNELRERITKDRVANDTVVINANYEIKELIKEIENENRSRTSASNGGVDNKQRPAR